jgi:hypothetical protein
MKTLSIQRPRPSIEIWMPARSSAPVKAVLVNWLPWSVLKMCGLARRRTGTAVAVAVVAAAALASAWFGGYALTIWHYGI